MKPSVPLLLFQTIRIISTVLGLAPCSIKLSSRSPKGFIADFGYSPVGSAYNLLLTVFSIGVLMITLPQLKDMPFPNSITRTITIFINVLVNIISIVIIIFYIIKQKDIIQIGNIVQEFDKKYGNKLSGRCSSLPSDLRKLIPLLVLLLLWTTVITITIATDQFVYLIIGGLGGGILSGFSMQYSFVVNILTNRMEDINNTLLNTAPSAGSNLKHAEAPPPTSSISTNQLVIDTLKMIHQARITVYRVSCKVSKFYSIPVLLVITVSCCACVHNLYFYVMELVYLKVEGRYTGAIDCLFWAVISLYPIAGLSLAVNAFLVEAVLQADRTADIVYDIKTSHESNKDMQSKLDDFAVELLHRKVTFQACGIFSLDCTLLHSIFGMIVTYLLILLQFNPSNMENQLVSE